MNNFIAVVSLLIFAITVVAVVVEIWFFLETINFLRFDCLRLPFDSSSDSLLLMNVLVFWSNDVDSYQTIAPKKKIHQPIN